MRIKGSLHGDEAVQATLFDPVDFVILHTILLY